MPSFPPIWFLVLLLFYRNLRSVAAARRDIIVRKPGSDTLSEKRVGKCIIEPVYGPCHNPLRITTTDGKVIVAYFGVDQLTPDDVQKQDDREGGTLIIVKFGMNSRVNLSYDIIALVSGISSNLDKLDYESVKQYLLSYEPNLDALGLFHSNRLSVIQPDILQAIKLSQVFEPRSTNQAQLDVAKEWHDRVYKEYSNLHGSKNVDDVRSDTTLTLKNIISDLREVVVL